MSPCLSPRHWWLATSCGWSHSHCHVSQEPWGLSGGKFQDLNQDVSVSVGLYYCTTVVWYRCTIVWYCHTAPVHPSDCTTITYSDTVWWDMSGVRRCSRTSWCYHPTAVVLVVLWCDVYDGTMICLYSGTMYWQTSNNFLWYNTGT